MPLILAIVFGIFLVLRNTRINASPEQQIRTIIKSSKYAPYEKFILNQAKLESGYFTNTLSKPPIYNPFSMGIPKKRKSNRIGEYSNPNIDDGQMFSVYNDYIDATNDFINYLDFIKIPLNLDCKEYNKFISSKGYAIDKLYEEKLNKMC